MAINALLLDALVQFSRQHAPPRRLCALGYPDMLVTEEQLAMICGPDILSAIRFREDSERILAWHGLRGRMPRVAETDSVFRALDIETDYLDIRASRGIETEVDLNAPLDATFAARYDIVYDGGTMEHCFNVGQVMRNILAMAKLDGHILHVNPANMYNHGFFGFSPTFYHDWYVQGGHEILTGIFAMHGDVLDSRMAILDPTGAIRALPERSVIVAAAQKRNDEVRQWPTQTKYLKAPDLKA